MKPVKLLVGFIVALILQACSTSRAIISYDIDLSKYSYVVLGKENSGDEELDDIMMAVQNEILGSKLQVLSSHEAFKAILQGKPVLTPKIHISTEKWEGGHTYIMVTFYDYETNKSVAILKSSGIGLSIPQDQRIALRAMRKKIRQVFGTKRFIYYD